MNSIYTFAEKNGIEIDNVHLCKLKALSLPNAIAIDESKMDNCRELRTCLIHEIGHCITGSFYNVNSKFDSRLKKEYIANVWAIENYIPFDELISVLRHGITELWAVAEFFNVTEEFMQKAFRYYEHKLKTYEKQL